MQTRNHRKLQVRKVNREIGQVRKSIRNRLYESLLDFKIVSGLHIFPPSEYEMSLRLFAKLARLEYSFCPRSEMTLLIRTSFYADT